MLTTAAQADVDAQPLAGQGASHDAADDAVSHGPRDVRDDSPTAATCPVAVA
ncbi:MAG TPA: hypothetical protein VL524_11615 [Gemmatimonadaceae bacterium]|nr:hypothetical protein [Gemmatimonadaceae bacterium]